MSVSNYINYLSCYYYLQVDDYTFKDGAKIDFTVLSQGDVRFYLYGGNSRTNASTSVTIGNTSLTTGQVYSVDVSMGAVLVILPVVNKTSSTSFSFTYVVSGSQYSWWESLIIGPNG